MRVLVTGASGQLGTDLVAALSAHDVTPCDRRSLDVGDPDAVQEALHALRPEVVVNCAAWTDVDACEADPGRAIRINGAAPRLMADAADAVGTRMIQLSTDYVFDGTKTAPYVEDDQPNPLSVYGRSKLEGEQDLGQSATVIRTSWTVGSHGRNMLLTLLRLLAGREPLRFVDDQRGCPTFTADLASSIRDFIEDHHPGIFHVTNAGAVSWFEFAQEVALAIGTDPERVYPISTDELDPPRPAPRPANSVLDNRALRFAGLPLLRDHREALDELVGSGSLYLQH
jgi:dTDP-4-dehydrorhamnose reductase